MATADDLRLHLNDRGTRDQAYGPAQKRVMSRETRAQAHDAITRWPGYAPTPLVDLAGLAARLGIAGLRIKHERHRFDLASFKALGGAYGVLRVLASRTGRSMDDIVAGRAADAVRDITVCCATDGNHGRAVAWGATLAGARSVIYLHEHVSRGREEAIAARGAQIVRVPGTYDDSVRMVAEDARRRDWIVVSDTSWSGYEEIPAWVMQGYSVMTEEMTGQLGGRRPTHLFVQAGVGGLAAAAIAPLWEEFGNERPYCVVVEPHAADCVYRSAVRGALADATGSLETVMACLAAGKTSPLAWAILEHGADAFITIADHFAPKAMIMLARDPRTPLVAGESGAAGLAGLLAILADAPARSAVGLDASSDVLLIASEGATDPAIYSRIVGSRPEDITEAVAGP